MPANEFLAELGLNVPHIDQYFGLWCIQEAPFQAAVARVSGIDLRAHVELQQREPQSSARVRGRDYETLSGGVAVIELSGPMMKYASSLSGGTSTVLARRQIRNAIADEDVRAILLKIDSPGGTIAGTADLADEVANAGREKPVQAYIEDLGASAAYWVASAAGKVFANRMGWAGAIGTYGVIYDFSGLAAREGIKAYVMRAGKFKGAGTEGTEITPEQLAEWQRRVDEANEFFLEGVAAGRKLALSTVRELADGRVHIGQAAVDLKLIDGVQSFDATLSNLRQRGGARASAGDNRSLLPSEPGETTVSTETNTTEPAAPQPASSEQLKTACIGADNDFLCEQLSRKATVEEAKGAWMAEQNQRLEKANQEAEQAKAAANRPGVDALGGGGSGASDFDGDAVSAWNAAIAEKQKTTKDRARAVRQVVHEQPDLHEAYLEAVNAAKGRSVVIAGRVVA